MASNTTTGTPLTENQLLSLQPVIQSASALSILGSLAIILTYTFVTSFRRPSNRLVFLISIADLLASVCMFMAAWPVKGISKETNSVPVLCTIQGWGITFFLISAMFWTGCLSFQCLLAIRQGTKLEKLENMEKWFHIVSWGIPFAMATAMLFLGNAKDGPVYTDAVLWCWIGPNYQGFRFYFFYMWLWGIFLFNIFVYVFVGSTLWITQKRLAEYGRDSNAQSNWQPSRSMRLYVRKTSFFIIAFFINWFWGSLNRIQNMIDPLHPIFALFLLHSIFTPLQGFLNFIAYFLVHFLFKATNGEQQETRDTTTKETSSTPFHGDMSQGPNISQYTKQDMVAYLELEDKTPNTPYTASTFNVNNNPSTPDYQAALSPKVTNFGYPGLNNARIPAKLPEISPVYDPSQTRTPLSPTYKTNFTPTASVPSSTNTYPSSSTYPPPSQYSQPPMTPQYSPQYGQYNRGGGF
ncbi:hypothetical protein HK098_001857 [Nowakowskiella sp. JEL0407]|nr:hypothetical protein HK098_001857 [Nowakowskiella sp. JEL0407]